MANDYLEQYLEEMRKIGATPSFTDNPSTGVYGTPYREIDYGDPAFPAGPSDLLLGRKGQPLPTDWTQEQYREQGAPLEDTGIGTISFEPLADFEPEGTLLDKSNSLKLYIADLEAELLSDKGKLAAQVLEDPYLSTLSKKMDIEQRLVQLIPSRGTDGLNAIRAEFSKAEALKKNELAQLSTKFVDREAQLIRLKAKADIYAQEAAKLEQIDQAKAVTEARMDVQNAVLPETLDILQRGKPQLDSEEKAKAYLRTGGKDARTQKEIALARRLALGESITPNILYLQGEPEMVPFLRNIELSKLASPELQKRESQKYRELDLMWQKATTDEDYITRVLNTKEGKKLQVALDNAAQQMKVSGSPSNLRAYEAAKQARDATVFSVIKQEWKQAYTLKALDKTPGIEELSLEYNTLEIPIVTTYLDKLTELQPEERTPNNLKALAETTMQEVKLPGSPLEQRRYMSKLIEKLIPVYTRRLNEDVASLGIAYTRQDLAPLFEYNLLEDILAKPTNNFPTNAALRSIDPFFN